MSEATKNVSQLQEWIGKTQTVNDVPDASHANKMAGTLNDETVYRDGDPLPPAWHWAWFVSGSLQSELGRDGHPARGGFMPPVALPRRMWAGSELTFEKPMLVGETIAKTSTIEDVQMKSGSSGELCFVKVRHDFSGSNGDSRFTERQTIVYREDPAPGAPAPKPVEPPAGDLIETVTPETTLLFRYSALTFNTHRIHYDRDYCLNVEGYPGLVVHGPLQATLLAGHASAMSDSRKVTSLKFRAMAPLYDTADFSIWTDGEGRFWTQTPLSGVAMMLTAAYDA